MSEAESFITSMKEDDMWVIGGVCAVCDDVFDDDGGYAVDDGLSACWECMWMMYGKSDSEKEKSAT